jgi:hypothetical protein
MLSDEPVDIGALRGKHSSGGVVERREVTGSINEVIAGRDTGQDVSHALSAFSRRILGFFASLLLPANCVAGPPKQHDEAGYLNQRPSRAAKRHIV